MKKILQPFLFFLVVVIVASCTDRRQKQSKQDEMYFEVNDELLGKEQKSQLLGIAYNPPKNWNKVEGEARQKLSKTLNEMGATEDVKLIDVYFEPASRSLLFLSDISALPDSAIGYAIANHQKYFSTGNQQENIKAGSFSHNNFKIIQFLIQNPSMVNFKLWFLEGAERKFQIDFMVPAQGYAQKIKEIESSIGSVHTINQ